MQPAPGTAKKAGNCSKTAQCWGPEVKTVQEMFFLFFLFENKYFSPLINVSLHPKFSFSICLVQTLKEEENKAGREE